MISRRLPPPIPWGGLFPSRAPPIPLGGLFPSRAIFLLLLGGLIGVSGEMIVNGAMTTNKLVLSPRPSQMGGETMLQFGSDPYCIRLVGRGENALDIVNGQGLSFASFATTEAGGGTGLSVDSLVVRNHLQVAGGTLSISGIPQWRLHTSEVFDLQKEPTGWDSNIDVVSSCAGVTMLGGYGKFAKGEIAKTFEGLPPHSFLRIKANFHFIDNWTGDTGFMRVNAGKDGSLVHVWTESHKVQGTNGVNLCGKINVPETKFTVPIDVTLPHSMNSIKVAFGSTLQTNIPEEVSWGVSLLELYLK